jgi:hypothetical protein
MSFPGIIYGEPDWAGMRWASRRVGRFNHEARREICVPVFGAGAAAPDLGVWTLPASATKLFSGLGNTRSAAAGVLSARSSDIERQVIRLCRPMWLPVGRLRLPRSFSKKRRGSIRA